MAVLAKKPASGRDADESATLRFHSACVADCFGHLFGTAASPTRLCREWLRFFRLPSDACLGFCANGLAACFLHDLGKANTGFAALLAGQHVQALRHEQISALLLNLPHVGGWLTGMAAVQLDCVTCAVLGHHLHADRRTFGRPAADNQVFRLLLGGVEEVLQLLGQRLGLPLPLPMALPECWRFDQPLVGFDANGHAQDLRCRLERLGRSWRRQTAGPSPDHRLSMAVRAALVAADAAASGLVREGKTLESWIASAFREDRLLDGQAIDAKVLLPRVAQIAKRRGSFRWTDFQEAAETLPDRALILQPCGSGKTLAAWRWIRGRGEKRPVSRVIFLYPTRGTATEGFRDYVSWAPETDAALVQGTAAYDLLGIMENFPECDPRRGRDFTMEDRLFALAFWQRRVFSATVDQFLGFMQNQYRSICLLPLLVDSAVVIDEVHSFDRNLFSSLKAFLRAFDVPVLCMTASLTAARRQDLAACGLAIFPEDPKAFADLAEKAEMPRYATRVLRDAGSVEREALQAVQGGKRVLWVVNTVDRCRELARTHRALCYHSRFRLMDRRGRHHAVVEAFQGEDRSDGVLAVTTQVCEMSLDLDADVLISEVAPIPSMIQRLGRCNRHARPSENRIGQAFFYLPESSAPYSSEELGNVAEFLAAIDGQTISQSRLEKLLEQYGPDVYEPERYAAFIDDGPWAQSRDDLRDIGDFTQSVVLDVDLQEFLRLRNQREPADGLLLAVPTGFAVAEPRLPRGIGLAPAANYSPLYGFGRQPVESQG